MIEEAWELPPEGDDKVIAQRMRKWLDDHTYWSHPLRVQDASTWRRAELYDQGAQWLNRARAGYEGGGFSQWVSVYWDRNDPNYIPTPVFNEGLPARQNETARLGSPNPRPVVVPRSKDVRVRDGAKRATDSLRHRLDAMGWKHRAWKAYYHAPLYGGTWIRSAWDEGWDDIVTVPSLTAKQCPQCKLILGNPGSEQSMGAFAMGRNALASGMCPQCPDHPVMGPYQPTMEEAAGADAFGNPLGSQQPKGDWEVTVESPYGMFPKDIGFGMEFGNITETVHVHLESMDWVARKYRDKAAEVRPDNAADMLQRHAILGAPTNFGAILNSKMFRDRVTVTELVKRPYMRRVHGPKGVSYEWCHGRYAVMIGDELMENGPLEVASKITPGEYVEKVRFEYIPWEFRDGGQRIQGLSQWELMFDPQDAGNEIRSQTQAVRQRLAVPLYLVLRSQNFDIVEMGGGVPGKALEIDNDVGDTVVEPKLINNTTIDAGVRAELDDALNYLDRVFRTKVEGGDVPPGVGAASAIRFLKASASEGRQPRVDRFNQALERIFKHGAQLQGNFYFEPREYRFEDEEGTESWDNVTSLDFAGQTDVKVESEPDFDEKARDVEVVREMLTTPMGQQLLLPGNMTNLARRRLLVALDFPEKILEQDQVQEAAAQREFIAFREEGVVPRVDPGLDSHPDHHEIHGLACYSDWFRGLEQAAGWDEALKILGANWDQNLQMVATNRIPDPMTGMMMVADPQLEPLSIQARVFAFWGIQLAQAKFPGLGGPGREALQAVLDWRSHLAAHKLHGEMSQMQAMTMPTMAAPGAPETAAGTEPTPGQPPVAPQEQMG